MLSDTDILKELEKDNIVCQPLCLPNISNSSIDLRLGKILKIPNPAPEGEAVKFDLDENGKLKVNYGEHFTYTDYDLEKRPYILKPGEFLLGSTLEVAGSNCNFISCQLADKSTTARLGISTLFSAGYIDVFNYLNITVEIKSNAGWPIELKYGMQIAQLLFFYTHSPATNVYNGKYRFSKTTEQAK